MRPITHRLTPTFKKKKEKKLLQLFDRISMRIAFSPMFNRPISVQQNRPEHRKNAVTFSRLCSEAGAADKQSTVTSTADGFLPIVESHFYKPSSENTFPTYAHMHANTRTRTHTQTHTRRFNRNTCSYQ